MVYNNLKYLVKKGYLKIKMMDRIYKQSMDYFIRILKNKGFNIRDLAFVDYFDEEYIEQNFENGEVNLVQVDQFEENIDLELLAKEFGLQLMSEEQLSKVYLRPVSYLRYVLNYGLSEEERVVINRKRLRPTQIENVRLSDFEQSIEEIYTYLIQNSIDLRSFCVMKNLDPIELQNAIFELRYDNYIPEDLTSIDLLRLFCESISLKVREHNDYLISDNHKFIVGFNVNLDELSELLENGYAVINLLGEDLTDEETFRKTIWLLTKQVDGFDLNDKIDFKMVNLCSPEIKHNQEYSHLICDENSASVLVKSEQDEILTLSYTFDETNSVVISHIGVSDIYKVNKVLFREVVNYLRSKVHFDKVKVEYGINSKYGLEKLFYELGYERTERSKFEGYLDEA